MTPPLRIAMLAHSTNPRGGVVHAMQLSEALNALGHVATLHAPDPSRRGFFRAPDCGTQIVDAAPACADMTAMVEQRIADYVRHFENPAARRFDLYHAHDGISGNALATLKERGLIPGYVRTVHHIDAFSQPRLQALQQRSIDRADALFTVSDHWRDELSRSGRPATTVGNGVDMKRFRPEKDASDVRFAARSCAGKGPVFLSVGGIEGRKNTIRILQAFAEVRTVRASAQLVIAGGVSLLDHSAYQQQFHSVLSALAADRGAVHILGRIEEDDMPALYRMADTLVFPSLKEGYGLVVLEAMASATPVVVPRTAPFTEYLGDGDAIWCDPQSPVSIADAMLSSLAAPVRGKLVEAGLAVAAGHGWEATATAHLETYFGVKEHAHA